MRYYKYELFITEEEIEKNAQETKIRLKDYFYENAFGAVNGYMYQKLDNGTSFFIYRGEKKVAKACFSYDEKEGTNGIRVFSSNKSTSQGITRVVDVGTVTKNIGNTVVTTKTTKISYKRRRVGNNQQENK